MKTHAMAPGAAALVAMLVLTFHQKRGPFSEWDYERDRE